MLDINFRSSTVLGIVGGGGIGFLLNQSVQTLAYRTTGAIIILTFVIVLAIEQLAGGCVASLSEHPTLLRSRSRLAANRAVNCPRAPCAAPVRRGRVQWVGNGYGVFLSRPSYCWRSSG
jgi:hypothetical protein